MKSGGGSGGKVCIREKGVKTGGVSDMKNNMGLQGGFVGGDGDSAVVNRGGSSTIASYLPKKEEQKRWAVLW